MEYNGGPFFYLTWPNSLTQQSYANNTYLDFMFRQHMFKALLIGAEFESTKKCYEKTREIIFVDLDRGAIQRNIHHTHKEKKHVILVSYHSKALKDGGLFFGG